MREFLGTPFFLVAQIFDYIYAVVSGNVVVRIVSDEETSEVIIDHLDKLND